MGDSPHLRISRSRRATRHVSRLIRSKGSTREAIISACLHAVIDGLGGLRSNENTLDDVDAGSSDKF